jgi:nitroreductase
MQLDNALLRAILSAGLQAPSAENKHYLRFQDDGDGVLLRSNDTATWAEQPHRRFLAHLAYGAVVENMVLQSGTSGVEASVQWQPAPGNAADVARISWQHRHVAPDTLADQISRRHVNRRFYRRDTVSADALEQLAAAAHAIPGARLIWLDDPVRRRTALKAIRIAETERFRRRALHQELFSAVRFDIGWRTRCDEWLAPATLEVEAPMRPGFAAMRSWPVMRALAACGAHHLMGLRAGYLPCALAPHLAMLVIDNHSDTAFLQAGRALQRVWLAATAESLAFQPMAAAVALSHQHAGGSWVSAQTQQRLRVLLKTLADGRQPAMLFRVGRADEPTMVSGRPPLDGFLEPRYLALDGTEATQAS